ncbi:MAG: hypothetical protein ABR607_10805 [Pyrinomonadaceae bacterium]
MYYRNTRLDLSCLVFTVLAVQLLAVTVKAQTLKPFFQNRVSIKHADSATINQQALDAMGAASNQPRPNPRDMMFSEQAPSNSRPNGWRVDKPETPGKQKVHPDRDNLLTIPHWSDSFSYHGLRYKYTMVGTDPKRGSATTIPTVLIPIRFVFENGLVMDASADSIDGQTSIQGIINSPIFQSHDFNVGGISVGNTQYGDAFQRANFWDSVSRGSSDYHVLLGQPTVAPAFEVHVPEYAAFFITDTETGAPVPLIEGGFLDQATNDAIRSANISPQTLGIVIWGNVFGWGFGAFHGICEFPGGARTCIGTGYHPRSPSYFGLEDVNLLSHEVLEWMDDPFTENFTPGWNFPEVTYPHCLSWFVSDKLEVADVLEFYLEGDVPINMGTATYHVADAVFLDYFTRTSPSRSANGKYSFFGIMGIANSPSPPCAGHVEIDMKLLEYPNAVFTKAYGINNNGSVVGYFIDSSNRRHGFLYDGRNFTQLDYPDAVRTFAYKVNDAGQIVGGYADTAGLTHGFSYFRGRFTPISFPGSLDNTSIARGINSRGDIVGLYDLTVEITHGFIYQNGQYSTLDTPFAPQTDVLAINDSGRAVGYVWDDPFNGPFRGFSRDNTGFTRIDFPGASDTFPWTVNNGGMHGGTFFDPFFGGDGYVTIYGYPYEVYANVFGMNDKSQIVGSTFDFSLFRTLGYVATLPK